MNVANLPSFGATVPTSSLIGPLLVDLRPIGPEKDGRLFANVVLANGMREANSYVEKSRYDDALLSYGKILRENLSCNNSTVFLFNVAVTYALGGDIDKAVSTMNRAFYPYQKRPIVARELSRGFCALSARLREHGRCKEAYIIIARAYSIYDDEIAFRTKLIRSLIEHRHFSAAMEAMGSVPERGIDPFEKFRVVAKYVDRNIVERGNWIYNDGISLGLELAKVLMALRRYSAAEKVMDSTPSKGPDPFALLRNMMSRDKEKFRGRRVEKKEKVKEQRRGSAGLTNDDIIAAFDQIPVKDLKHLAERLGRSRSAITNRLKRMPPTSRLAKLAQERGET